MFNVPFFPSLRLPIANRRFDSKPEEAEVLRYERDYRKWLESIKNTASDINPLGKVESADRPETDDEDANDSEDTDSHEEEDDDTNGAAPATEDALRSTTEDINLANT